MSLNSRQSLQGGKVHRGLALILLVFAFTDLVFVDILTAQPCLEVSSSSECLSGSLLAGDLHPGDLLSSSGENDRDKECCVDEDCFCCCSNVIHGVSQELAQLNEPRQPADARLSSLPLSLPDDPFHPPRI